MPARVAQRAPAVGVQPEPDPWPMIDIFNHATTAARRAPVVWLLGARALTPADPS